MRKIKYTCKECGWETSIYEEWEDLKPQRCMNKKCNTSFRVKPDSLIITKPEAKIEAEPVVSKPKENKNGRNRKD